MIKKSDRLLAVELVGLLLPHHAVPEDYNGDEIVAFKRGQRAGQGSGRVAGTGSRRGKGSGLATGKTDKAKRRRPAEKRTPPGGGGSH